MTRTIVLASGGIDSTTLLAVEAGKARREVTALWYDYGQAAPEWEAVYAVTRQLGVAVVRMSLGLLNGGPLLTGIGVPDVAYGALPDGPAPTVVPFRNALLISHAVNVALEMDARRVLIGCTADDWARGAYPDCSPEFISAMTLATSVATGHAVLVQAPFMRMSKAVVVALAREVKAPLELTRSCYRAGTPCGTCSACQARAAVYP